MLFLNKILNSFVKSAKMTKHLEKRISCHTPAFSMQLDFTSCNYAKTNLVFKTKITVKLFLFK